MKHRTVNTVMPEALYNKAVEVSKRKLGLVNLAGLIKYLISKEAEELGLNDK